MIFGGGMWGVGVAGGYTILWDSNGFPLYGNFSFSNSLK